MPDGYVTCISNANQCEDPVDWSPPRRGSDIGHLQDRGFQFPRLIKQQEVKDLDGEDDLLPCSETNCCLIGLLLLLEVHGNALNHG